MKETTDEDGKKVGDNRSFFAVAVSSAGVILVLASLSPGEVDGLTRWVKAASEVIGFGVALGGLAKILTDEEPQAGAAIGIIGALVLLAGAVAVQHCAC